jgi:flagellar hook-associated protein 3 FlgL
MRVTENGNFETIRNSIQRSRERMDQLQQQSSSLRKLNQPSDDPMGASKVLELRTDKMNNDQFQENARTAETFLSNTDLVLTELSEVIGRAKEIALNQSSIASSSEDTRVGVSEEIGQLFQQAVSAGNRRVGDRYLLGGFRTQKPPFDAEGSYRGDDGQIMIEIAGDVFLTMNLSGAEVVNTHPESMGKNYSGKGYGTNDQGQLRGEHAENVNLYDELQNLRTALLTGDMEGIRGTLERFDEIQSQLITTRAKLGSRLQGLQSTHQALERQNITNAALSSSIEDADIAQVVTDLGKEESVFKSSLATSRRLIQPTLLDFLK